MNCMHSSYNFVETHNLAAAKEEREMEEDMCHCQNVSQAAMRTVKSLDLEKKRRSRK
jgi:hypothetical protein